MGTQPEKSESERIEAEAATPGCQDVGDVHGAWLVVSRRKRTSFAPKDQAKFFNGMPLSNRFENSPTYSKKVGHVGDKGKGLAFNASAPPLHFAPPNENKTPKSGWQLKKRRHGEGPTIHTTHVITPKVNLVQNLSDPKPNSRKKEVHKEIKVVAPAQKPTPNNRMPLQESSKQNIITHKPDSGNNLKGFKTAMHIEQVSHNHFQFTEENKPPDGMVETMEPMEESKEIENNDMADSMQEDGDMGGGTPSHMQNG